MATLENTSEISQLNESKNENFFMSSSVDKKNRENLCKILPYFFYNQKDENLISAKIQHNELSHKDKYIPNMFTMNNQDRAWFSVNTFNPTQDPGFLLYVKMLEHFAFNSQDGHTKYLQLCEKYQINTYEVFKSGKLQKGKQTEKLFKFLIRENILTSDAMDKINAVRIKDEQIYLCISKNPIDYLFCSTNQSFKSCENLQSDHGGAFYLGLPSLVLDPNRIMIFTTNGKLKDYKIKDYSFNHFRFSCRSWAILTIQDIFYIIRYYPSRILDFPQLFKTTDYKIENLPPNPEISKFIFNLPKYNDKSLASIYYDYYGVAQIATDKYRYSRSANAITGRAATSFSWPFGFEKITKFEWLHRACSICNECDEIFPSEEFVSCRVDSNTIKLCKVCYEKHYTTCTMCGTSYNKNTDTSKYKVCDGCYDKSFKCKNCYSLRTIDEIIFLPDEDKYICHSCVEVN